MVLSTSSGISKKKGHSGKHTARIGLDARRDIAPRLRPILLWSRAVDQTASTRPISEIYCSASEQVGQDSLARLEQLTSFFGELPEFTAKGNAPIRVVRFSSDEQFTPYKAYEWEGGHYEDSPERRARLGPRRASPRPAGRRVPRTRPSGGSSCRVSVATLAGRGARRFVFNSRCVWRHDNRWRSAGRSNGSSERREMGGSAWFDFARSKRIRGTEDRRCPDLFYAEELGAYAYVISRAGSTRLSFQSCRSAALNHSKSPGDVFQQIYHKSPDAIYTDLKNYVAQKAVGRKEFPAPDVAKREVTVSPVTVFVSDLVKADLLSVMSGEEKKAAAARTAFEQLQRDYSAVAEIQRLPAADGPEVAGLFIQLAADGWDSRRSNPELLTAVEGITQLPQIQQAQPNQAESLAEMYFRVGLLERTAKQPASKAAEPLKKAVVLRPDYPAARVQLGDVYVEMKDFPAAIPLASDQLIPPGDNPADKPPGLSGTAILCCVAARSGDMDVRTNWMTR